MQKVAIVLRLVALGMLAGCGTTTPVDPAPVPKSAQVTRFYEPQTPTEEAFAMLSQMKQNAWVTADQHEKLRQNMVNMMGKDGYSISGDTRIRDYIRSKYTDLSSIHKLMEDGRLTNAEFDSLQKNIVGLPKA